MTNITLKPLVFAFLCVAAATSYAGSIPVMDVAVSDSSRKVVFRGKTSADGAFSTGKLPPGSYIVQFNSKAAAARGSFALLAQAGRNKVSVNAVPASQFTGAGVAMKLDVPVQMSIVGQIAPTNLTGGTGNAKVKIVNGRRYVWISHAGIGSNLGGRWEEEGVSDRFNAHSMSTDSVRRLQEAVTPHQEGFPGGATSNSQNSGVAGSRTP